MGEVSPSYAHNEAHADHLIGLLMLRAISSSPTCARLRQSRTLLEAFLASHDRCNRCSRRQNTRRRPLR